MTAAPTLSGVWMATQTAEAAVLRRGRAMWGRATATPTAIARESSSVAETIASRTLAGAHQHMTAASPLSASMATRTAEAAVLRRGRAMWGRVTATLTATALESSSVAKTLASRTSAGAH